MTYEELVRHAREAFENADARNIFEHIAIQVNVTGEGSGIFYIECAERAISVEPYDYYDRDVLVTLSSEVVLALAKGKMTYKEAVEVGLIKVEGNLEKARQSATVKPRNRKKKSTGT